MKNILSQGYKDSVGTYVAEGEEYTIYETEEQARVIATQRAQQSGRTIEEELQYVESKHIDFKTYVEKIGKIQDSANKKISDMSVDPAVQRAQANAEASGKSGK